MKYAHEYGSYAVPTPIIKDVGMAVEDAAGDLTVTHQLVFDASGQADELDNVLRMMKKKGSTIDIDAAEYRLTSISALLSASEARLKDGIILLHATIDTDNRQRDALRGHPAVAAAVDKTVDLRGPVDENDQQEMAAHLQAHERFDGARSAYLAADAAFKATAEETPERDVALDNQEAAMRRFFETPAPTIGALVTKIETMTKEYGDSDGNMQLILFDLHRLAQA